MSADRWVKWLGPAAVLLVLVGGSLAIVGTLLGDPDLSRGGLDILKVLTGGVVGALVGRQTSGAKSQTDSGA